uniref:Uncharacterized protein n=1 Tax=Panagrellus redivivus TaxID=6233 RepID=A0A7E4W1L1_PANRE
MGISWGKRGDKDVKKSKLDRASLAQPAAPAHLRPYSASRRHSASVSTDTLCCCVHCALIAAASCPPWATQSISSHANQRRCGCQARHVIDKESVIRAIENVASSPPISVSSLQQPIFETPFVVDAHLKHFKCQTTKVEDKVDVDPFTTLPVRMPFLDPL